MTLEAAVEEEEGTDPLAMGVRNPGRTRVHDSTGECSCSEELVITEEGVYPGVGVEKGTGLQLWGREEGRTRPVEVYGCHER